MPRPLLGVALACTALASTACVSARTELTIAPGGVAEGFVEAIVPRAALEAQGIDPDDPLARIDLADYVSTPAVAAGNRVELALPQGDEVVATVRFAEVDADSIGILGGEPFLSIAADGSMTVDTEVDTSTLGEGSTLDVAIEFPFEVVEHDGELDGSTVRWSLDQADGARRLLARTNAEPYLSSPASVGWLAVSAAMVAAFVLGGGFLLWLWSRRSERRPAGG